MSSVRRAAVASATVAVGLMMLGAPAARAAGANSGGRVTIGVDCARAGIDAGLQNDTDHRLVFTVEWTVARGTAFGARRRTVPAHSTASIVIVVPERTPIDVTGLVGADVVQHAIVTRDCSRPSATVSFSCTALAAAVVLRNLGDGAYEALIHKNGQLVVGPVKVAAHSQKRELIPMVWRELAEIDVTTTDNERLADEVVVHDCSAPVVRSIGPSCADHGVAIVVGDTGTEDATFRFTKDGHPIGADVEVGPARAVRFVVPYGEDERATVGVETSAGVLTTQTFTLDCVQVAGEKTTRAGDPGTTLPVTGADTVPLTIAGGLLVLSGGLLVALSERLRSG